MAINNNGYYKVDGYYIEERSYLNVIYSKPTIIMVGGVKMVKHHVYLEEEVYSWGTELRLEFWRLDKLNVRLFSTKEEADEEAKKRPELLLGKSWEDEEFYFNEWWHETELEFIPPRQKVWRPRR